ncbi:hypothetical protein MTR67_043936 [Solanum verrucosum]|uniref:Uncharacterized protein n=1 Tax=Solanum verrucosum TaxID=315347 RepID=A0AAF0ZT49_SOLVR|nr:hypothetical protein MTR67_043936 [Solanum verrucosum]
MVDEISSGFVLCDGKHGSISGESSKQVKASVATVGGRRKRSLLSPSCDHLLSQVKTACHPYGSVFFVEWIHLLRKEKVHGKALTISMPPILFDVYCTGRLYGEHFSQVFMVHITIGEGLMDFKLPAVIWDIPWTPHCKGQDTCGQGASTVTKPLELTDFSHQGNGVKPSEE